MKGIIFSALFFASTLTSASGRIPFLFLPRHSAGVGIILTPDLNFYWGTYKYENGWSTDFLATGSRTMILQNDGFEMSGNISLEMEFHNGAFSISNDTCNFMFLMPGESCTFDIFFNGTIPSQQYISLDAVQDNTLDRTYIRMQYCPGC